MIVQLDKLVNSMTRETKRLLDTTLLEMIVEAQSFGDCPWCDVPIGAYHYHYMHTCPFTTMARLLNLRAPDNE